MVHALPVEYKSMKAGIFVCIVYCCTLRAQDNAWHTVVVQKLCTYQMNEYEYFFI